MDVPHAVSAPIPPYPQISADSQRSSSFIKPHQPSSTTRHFFLKWVSLAPLLSCPRLKTVTCAKKAFPEEEIATLEAALKARGKSNRVNAR